MWASEGDILEETITGYYDILRQYLLPQSDEFVSKQRISSKDKLISITTLQFVELSNDVIDELSRRMDSSSHEPFLRVQNHFTVKRNINRQRLASLKLSKFKDLALDVYLEIERRFPGVSQNSSGFQTKTEGRLTPEINTNLRLDNNVRQVTDLGNLVSSYTNDTENQGIPSTPNHSYAYTEFSNDYTAFAPQGSIPSPTNFTEPIFDHFKPQVALPNDAMLPSLFSVIQILLSEERQNIQKAQTIREQKLIEIFEEQLKKYHMEVDQLKEKLNIHELKIVSNENEVSDLRAKQVQPLPSTTTSTTSTSSLAKDIYKVIPDNDNDKHLIQEFDKTTRKKITRGSWDGQKLYERDWIEESHNNTLLKLWKTGVPGCSFSSLTPSDIEPLAVSLRYTSYLRVLDLVNSSLGSEGTKAIVSALHSHPSLQFLDLSSNNIAVEGARAIASLLIQNTTLQILSLSNNDIGDDGARAIVGALRDNKALQILYLSSNHIGHSGAQAISEALMANTSLQILSLYNNTIGDDGATTLALALTVNTSLRILYLSSNLVGARGANFLVNSLARNAVLEILYLKGNAIPVEICDLLEGVRATLKISLTRPE
ncbi:component of the polarisome [Nowakowskiella sp. JEL0078]|nr:component of the polarisome [Nowakowskiella sp. JEL0078]